MSAVFIVDADGRLTFKEFEGIKMKDYFRKCKDLTKGKKYTPAMLLEMGEEIRDVYCPCCLDETGYFEVLVGLAHKKKLIVLDEDGNYTICVGCLTHQC